MKGKLRNRIGVIKTIPEKPRVLATVHEGSPNEFKIYSLGIRLDGNFKSESESFANIQVTDKDDDKALEKIKKIMKVDKEGELIQAENTYDIYEESTDEDEHYWKVKNFVKKEPNKSYKEEEVGDLIKDSKNNGARSGMLFNNAVQIALLEKDLEDKRPIMEKIEANYKALKQLLERLE